jgi:hypothetical protein
MFDFPAGTVFVPVSGVGGSTKEQVVEEVVSLEGLGRDESVLAVAAGVGCSDETVLCRANWIVGSDGKCAGKDAVWVAFRVYLFPDAEPDKAGVVAAATTIAFRIITSAVTKSSSETDTVTTSLDLSDPALYPRSQWLNLPFPRAIATRADMDGTKLMGEIVSLSANAENVLIDTFIISSEKLPLVVKKRESIKQEDLEELLSFKALVRQDVELVRQSFRELRAGDGNENFFSDWFIAWCYWLREMLIGFWRFLFYTVIIVAFVAPAYLLKYVLVVPSKYVYWYMCIRKWEDPTATAAATRAAEAAGEEVELGDINI